MSKREVEDLSSNIFIVLTKEGIGVLLLSFMALTFGINNARLIIILPSLVFPIFFITFGFNNLKSSNRKMNFVLSTPINEIKAKQFLPISISLTNTDTTIKGILSIDVSDGLFPVKSTQNMIIDSGFNTTASFVFYAPRRGKEKIYKLVFKFSGIIGLFHLETKIIIDKDIIVVPEPQRVTLPWKMKQKILEQLVSEISVPVKGRGSDFLSLRDYQYGDEIRYIHWKSTAKYNKLIIKEFEEPLMMRFLIVVDTSLLMAGPKLEFALSSVVEIASVINKSHHSLSVVIHGNNYSKMIHLGNSIAAMRTLAINLHNQKTEGNRFNYNKLRQFILDNKLKGSVMILLSDLELEADEVGNGITSLKKYMQYIFSLACNTPGFGTLALANVQDTKMYDVNQIFYRRHIIEPELTRIYSSREKNYKKQIVGNNAKFRVVEGYNTNVLLELKEMLGSSNSRRNTKRVKV